MLEVIQYHNIIYIASMLFLNFLGANFPEFHLMGSQLENLFWSTVYEVGGLLLQNLARV